MNRKRRKGYFYEKEEQAVIDYIKADNEIEKNKIFNETLFPAFKTMIESIIRRYKLYVPDEKFDQTFNETILYLVTKIRHYKPVIYEYEEITSLPEKVTDVVMINSEEKKDFIKNADDNSPKYIIVVDNDNTVPYKLTKKHYKAFSYFQTICKNYLMFKRMQYAKDLQRIVSYDTVSDIFGNDVKYSTDTVDTYVFAEKMIKDTSNEIQKMIEHSQDYFLNDNEIKVGNALVQLLNNWENLVVDGESNKLQKNKVLYYLREQTMMTTKMLRDNMACFKKAYYLLKSKELE